MPCWLEPGGNANRYNNGERSISDTVDSYGRMAGCDNLSNSGSNVLKYEVKGFAGILEHLSIHKANRKQVRIVVGLVVVYMIGDLAHPTNHTCT